ncbi:MAG: RagB/SusD family nutrient uptake outer membrane protein [Flavobacterium sp.]
MKNIKIVLAALMLSFFASCDSAIDIDQPGELSPEATFQTVEDLQKGMFAAYGAMSTISEISFNSIFTDEVRLGFANGGQGLNDGKYGFILNTNSNDAYSIWQSNYTLINFANRVIEGANNVHVTGSGIAAKNDIIAHCRLLRAYAHFKLISYFSTNPADMNAWGAILVDHVPATNEMLPRSTNEQIYKFIDQDLAFAVTNIQFNRDNSDRRFLSLDFIDAFKARMYAFKGDYANAKTYAEKVYNKYPLTPAGEYKYIWTDELVIEDEVIFKLDRIRNEAKIGSIWASVDATVAGSPFYAVSTDLYTALHNDEDVRYTTFISNTSDFSDPGKIVICKYPGSGGFALLNDEKVFRSSEMLFILAEAAVELGSPADVSFWLQQLNDARFTANVPTVATPATKQAALKMILDERRKELCYEGHRYLDLKRLGKRAGITGIERNPQDCSVNGACFLEIDSHKFTMPIPNDEIMPNTAIRGQQNPGY